MSRPQSVMRMDVHYYDEDRTPDLVVCGQWEYQQAQRKFGKTLAEAGQSSDLDYMAYVAYLAAKRQRLVAEGLMFDDWSASVLALEVHEDSKDGEAGKEGDTSGESPAPLDA